MVHHGHIDPRPSEDERQRVARAICRTGIFETGHGTCAAVCMDQLGSARDKCRHCYRVHRKLTEAVLSVI